MIDMITPTRIMMKHNPETCVITNNRQRLLTIWNCNEKGLRGFWPKPVPKHNVQALAQALAHAAAALKASLLCLVFTANYNVISRQQSFDTQRAGARYAARRPTTGAIDCRCQNKIHSSLADALINVPKFGKQTTHTDGCNPISD